MAMVDVLITTNRFIGTNTPKRLWAAYAEYRRKRRALAQLRSVDPRMLKDLGIDRSELESIVFNNTRDRRRSYGDD
jgi:uncharacterized protein YjiS (DUF1127 family)